MSKFVHTHRICANAKLVKNEWNLKLGDLAMIWREGCIIRAQFLQKLKTLMITTQNYKTFY